MTEVVGVRFERAGKIYYFASGDLQLAFGDHVIVDSSRGLDFGTVTTPVQETSAEKLNQPLRPVIRVATEADEKSYAEVKKLEPGAFAYCQQQIEKLGLPMKLIRVSYTFDGSKVVFYFSSENRVDFRELVKVLAGHFHTRIELRQVGVRDEARIVGGYSTCGRELCCASFLDNFHPVSIKMAKKQNLALNPAKISGVCGRLMCCLYYEYDENEGPEGGCDKNACPQCRDNMGPADMTELAELAEFAELTDLTKLADAETNSKTAKGAKNTGGSNKADNPQADNITEETAAPNRPYQGDNRGRRGPRRGRRPGPKKGACDNNCRECQQKQCSRRKDAAGNKGE